MKKKTINATIKSKVNSWLNSIEDVELRKIAKESCIVSGGCITSMLLKEDVNDFDIYFKDLESTKAIANYYAEKIRIFSGRKDIVVKVDGENFSPEKVSIFVPSSGVVKIELDKDELTPSKFNPIFASDNAIMLTGKIQLILRFYGSPEEIHENFDFVHCTNYWTYSTGVVTNIDALEAILARELVYKNSKYPLCAVIRTRKFIKRGWSINAGQYLKMCFSISKLDLTDLNVLTDQLAGVDSFYFTIIIEHIAKLKSKDESFKIDESYLFKVIDDIFEITTNNEDENEAN